MSTLIESRLRKPKASSMKHVMKCLLKTSLGFLPPKFELVQAWWWLWVKSASSRIYGIQPIPPSDKAMRRFGYFFHMCAQIQSAAELEIEIGIELIHASIAESSDA